MSNSGNCSPSYQGWKSEYPPLSGRFAKYGSLKGNSYLALALALSFSSFLSNLSFFLRLNCFHAYRYEQRAKGTRLGLRTRLSRPTLYCRNAQSFSSPRLKRAAYLNYLVTNGASKLPSLSPLRHLELHLVPLESPTSIYPARQIGR